MKSEKKEKEFQEEMERWEAERQARLEARRKARLEEEAKASSLASPAAPASAPAVETTSIKRTLRRTETQKAIERNLDDWEEERKVRASS